MKRGERFWCWWLHRYVYYVRAMERGNSFVFVFEDVCDVQFDFTLEQVKRLTKEAK